MARYLQQHLQEVGQNNEHLLEEQQNRPINGPPINAIPPMNPALVNPAAAAMNRDDNHELDAVDALFMLSGQQPVPNELHEPRNGLQNNNGAVLVRYSYDNVGNAFSALYYHPVWGFMSYANGVFTHVPNDHLYQPRPVEAIANGHVEHVPNGYFQQPQPVEANGNEQVGMEVDANFQQPLAFIANDEGRAELAENVNFDQQPPVEANGNERVGMEVDANLQQPQPLEANGNEEVGMEVDANFQQPSAFMANDEGRAELAENVNLLSLAFMEDANRQAATGEIGETAQQQQIDVDAYTAPAVAAQDALFKLGNRSENGQEKGDEVEMDEGHEDDHVDEHVNEPVNGPTGDSEPDMASSSSSSGYDASDDDESTQTIKTEISGSNSDPDEQYAINVAPRRESLDSANGSIPVAEGSSGSDDKNGLVPPPDVDAQVEVAGPAILAVGANDQALQADNQDNDGPGEVNNGNVPPNGDNQVVSRSDRQLRPRPNLKRKAEDNDGPGEVNNGNVPPNGDNHVAQVVGRSDRELRPRPNLKRKAEKGPTYVFDVLMYKDASFYLVHWCRNDWSEYPTTIPVAKVKQSSVLARKYEGQCHRYDEWLENVRQRSNFNDEVRRIRQLAKGLKADSAKMNRLSVDENGEKVDDEMEPKQTEFYLIYERFKVRFCDRLDLQDIKRTPFAFNENWFKWFLFSYSCYLDSLENNFKGDDDTYGLLDLHIICKHMAEYNSMADFDETLQEERRANGLTIS